MNLTFFADDPAGPALAPSLQGHPGRDNLSPGTEYIPRVSKAFLEVGQISARVPLITGNFGVPVFPQAHGQTAVFWKPDKQYRQNPSRRAPSIPLSAAQQLAQQSLSGRQNLFSQLHPEPHPGLGQAQEETLTEPRSGWLYLSAPGAAHITRSRGRAGGQVASNLPWNKSPSHLPTAILASAWLSWGNRPSLFVGQRLL